MKPLPSGKILRFTLALSVSAWMAGAGCLLGCSNEIQAAHHASNLAIDSAVASDSCPSSGSHDCCAQKRAEHPASNPPSTVEDDGAEFSSDPLEMTETCPLAASASAALSKTTSDTLSTEPLRADTGGSSDNSSGSIEPRSYHFYLLNRGPTYLRCCAFLI